MPSAPRSRQVKAASGGAAAGQQESQGGSIPAHILPLVEAIDKSGDELINDPTGSALEHYRHAVRKFLDAAVQDSMRVNSEASLGLSRKVFSTIARVDIALADLADSVLRNQQDRLKVKEIISQVKGLVVDLYR